MIKLFTLFILLNISLFARVNPFETLKPLSPTVDKNITNDKKILMNKDDGLRTVKVEAEDNITKEEPKILINKPLKPKKLSKEEIEKICKVEKPKMVVKKKKIIKAKIFTPTTYKLYKFLKIDVNYKDLTITTRKRYPIIKYYTIKSENKLVFNFDAKIHFSTRYKKFNSPKFKSYALGNHREENFFRVVIVTKKDIKNYEVTIKNNIAKIKYKK